MKMKTTLSIPAILALAILALLPLNLQAQRTWTGLGADNNWNTAANWDLNTPPNATGQTLIFDGDTRLSNTNNIITSLNGITFAETAGAFTLGGTAFILNGNITNNSENLQTINNVMSLNNNRTIDVGSVGITVTSGITQTSGTRQLFKLGTGVLTLEAANTYTGITHNQVGTLRMDTASLTGDLRIGAGSTYGGAVNTYTSATTNITGGGGSSIAGNLLLVGLSGSNSIQVAEDSSLTVGGTWTVGNIGTAASLTASVNLDLSASNSSVLANGVADNTVLKFATVTDATGTGFAFVNPGKSVTRLDLSSVASLPTSGGSTSVDYKTSGNFNVDGNNNVGFNTLTVTGAGSASSAGTGRMLGTGVSGQAYVLMEEGVAGDYTINMELGSRQVIIYNYSTAGSLILAGGFTPGNTPNQGQFGMAGPGTVILASGASMSHQAQTDISGGHFVANGTVGSSQYVIIRPSATLSGSGTFGGTGGFYSAVSIYDDATLIATNSAAKALTINGSLALGANASFEMELVESPFAALSVLRDPASTNPAVSLDGDLKLTLNYAPAPNEVITLLTSDYGVTGTFSSINGAAFGGPGMDQFALNFNSQTYNFTIAYGADSGASSVYLTVDASVIPEPGVLSLLLVGGTLLALRRRRVR